MRLKYRLLSVAQVLSLVIGIFGAAALGSGVAEEIITSLQLGDQRIPIAGGVFLLGVVGWIVFGRLRIRQWYAIGRRAGLSPGENGSFLSRLRRNLLVTTIDPLPDLVGTVDGRTVRARTYATPTSSGDSGGGARNYTIIEAELSRPTDASIILLPSSEGDETLGGMLPGDAETAAVDDDIEMVGRGSVEIAGELVTGSARKELLGGDEPFGVFVGDPTDAMLDTLEGELGMGMSLAMNALAERLREHPANDPATVSVNNRGLLLDADLLARQTRAAAAIADAVEQVETEAAVA